MKILIIYDSMYGNTKKIAEAMTGALISFDGVKTVSADEINQSDFEAINFLIVGSPTQGGAPALKLKKVLEQIPANALNGVKVAAFDTRFLEKDQNFALRLLIKIIGYAATRIAKMLQDKGGQLVIAPEGFIVEKKEGPLKIGELERAASWAKSLFPNI